MSTEMNHEPSGEPATHDAPPPTEPDAIDDAQEPAYFGQVPDGECIGGSNPNLKLLIIALVIVCGSALGLGLLFASVDKSANADDGVNSVMAEQNRLMREAMDMAREAQELNRQHMVEMRRAMEEAEGYGEYATMGDYAGAEGHDYEP